MAARPLASAAAAGRRMAGQTGFPLLASCRRGDQAHQSYSSSAQAQPEEETRRRRRRSAGGGGAEPQERGGAPGGDGGGRPGGRVGARPGDRRLRPRRRSLRHRKPQPRRSGGGWRLVVGAGPGGVRPRGGHGGRREAGRRHGLCQSQAQMNSPSP